MEDNSQLFVYIGKDKGRSTGRECNGVYFSPKVTINSSLLNSTSSNPRQVPQWLYSSFTFKLSNSTNATFIANGIMEFPNDFFRYLGKEPIIINAIETLKEFNESHKLTQKNESEPIIFSNYYIKKITKEDKVSPFLRIYFFVLLNLILLM